MSAYDDAIAQLPTASASTIKKLGWKGVMRSLAGAGRLVVTNHNEPEAVILSTAEYTNLIQSVRLDAGGSDDPLQALRNRFDARLQAIDSPDASEQLRNLMRKPGALGQGIKAGQTY